MDLLTLAAVQVSPTLNCALTWTRRAAPMRLRRSPQFPKCLGGRAMVRGSASASQDALQDDSEGPTDAQGSTAQGSTDAQASLNLGRRDLCKIGLAGASTLPAASLYLTTPSPSLAEEDEEAPTDLSTGKEINASKWLATHKAGDRTAVRGLDGDATYLVVDDDGSLAKYAINAVCTHMGCIVPWVPQENKFMCPCHGSQYNSEGNVIQGPAPLPLQLVNVKVADGTVLLYPWTDKDFRTGEEAWWVD